MTGLEVGGALAIIAVAVWIRRVARLGQYVRSLVMVIALLAALVLVGIVEIGYNPDRVFELGRWAWGLIR